MEFEQRLSKELEIEKNQLLQQIEAMKEDKLQFGRDKDRFIEDLKFLIKHLKDENQRLREENSCKPALTNNQQPKKNGIYFFSKYYGVEWLNMCLIFFLVNSQFSIDKCEVEFEQRLSISKVAYIHTLF